jgi:hypothetical protein
LVERVLGKDEVKGSSPFSSSSDTLAKTSMDETAKDGKLKDEQERLLNRMGARSPGRECLADRRGRKRRGLFG